MGIKKCFTLIELLVVIAIIAILASMLLPALNRARDTAKKTKCLSQIKTFGTIFMLYTDNYDGYLVPPRVPPYYTWGNAQMFPKKQLTFTSKFLWCPSREPDKLANISSSVGYDYGVSYYIASVPKIGTWGRLSRVKKTSVTAYLVESIGSYQVSASGPDLAIRHNKSTNVLFIDGHVENLKRNEISVSGCEFPWNAPKVGAYPSSRIGM